MFIAAYKTRLIEEYLIPSTPDDEVIRYLNEYKEISSEEISDFLEFSRENGMMIEGSIIISRDVKWLKEFILPYGYDYVDEKFEHSAEYKGILNVLKLIDSYCTQDNRIQSIIWKGFHDSLKLFKNHYQIIQSSQLLNALYSKITNE